MDEKYFICTDCGTLITQSEKDDDLSCGGGQAMCYCHYVEMQWDNEADCFEPIYFREFTDYVEIPAKIYTRLRLEGNTVIRLQMYRSWKRATTYRSK
jgi:hypothetical protein